MSRQNNLIALNNEKMITVTMKELRVLKIIKDEQNEPGHSDFLSTDAKSKSVGGIVSSLEKKDLIYDSYNCMSDSDFDGKRFKMWCMTDKATEIVGRPGNWD